MKELSNMRASGFGMKSKLQRLSAGLAILSLTMVMLAVPLAGCIVDSEKTTTLPEGDGQFPMTATDDLGRVVTIDEKPMKIVSLAPSNTEILFALGLADRVVAVSDYCNYPPEAMEKPNISVYPAPDIEQLIVLAPDLILAAEIQTADIIGQLEERGLTVFVLAPKTLDEVLDAITLVGELTGAEAAASALVTDMSDRIKAVTDRTDNLPQSERPRVFYIVWHDPLMAPGSGTFQDDLIWKAGGTNIAQDLTGWATIGLEAVVEANPEVMIASVSYETGGDLSFQFIKTEPRLAGTDARQNGRVYGIDGDAVSRTAPRIVEALELMAQMIQPEIFGAIE